MAVAQYLNAFADATGVPLDGDERRPSLVAPLFELPAGDAIPDASQRLLEEIGEFYGGAAPNVFRAMARRAIQLRAAWDYARGVLTDRKLPRLMKTRIGFAASVVTRSPYGINFHRRELLRLGVGENGLLEVLHVIQLFEAITKVADLLLMPPEIENQDMPMASQRDGRADPPR